MVGLSLIEQIIQFSKLRKGKEDAPHTRGSKPSNETF